MDSKGELVGEICSISTVFTSCPHRPHSDRSPVFVDWYLVLQIEENASVDQIRKRYRQLALQLHPDKNNHPKADVAFKLVSEAYECLSDKDKRTAFNSLRCNGFCKECITKAQQKTSTTENKRSCSHKSTEQTRPHRVLQALREAKKRLQEEARVIERCLRNHNGKSKDVSPLFDPSEYLVLHGYPHNRRVQAPRGYWYLRPGCVKNNSSGRREWCESPVYEITSDNHGRRTRSGVRF